ncbi:retrotransposable element Tf2 protein type 3 [Trichonephila clavipes]|nr:retrotransposable element Tf2 protein type 3 [Trichonephila clavipes]
MEEEAEKYYIIRGLKENRAIKIQLQSCSNIEELKEKMKILDIQEKSKSSKNEVIYPKYPMTRIPYHTNQFAHRQQYGGWNWRNDQSQHPDTITNTRYKNHIPEKILSDRNTAFTSSKFKHCLKQNNITQLLTTSHRPQTNGKVERVNKTIITRLKCESSNSSNKVPWTKILEKVTHQYNQTPHTITGFPPTYLMYGNLPFEISLKDNEIYPPLEEARKLAKERTEQYYKINKIRYDKKFQEADFKVGDLVMYEEFQYPNTRKLSPPYSGPYTVLRKCFDVLFEIDRPNALNKTDTELVHSVRLRHFHPSENFQLNYIQQNTHNNENKIITKRNILRNTEITEFCLTRLFGEKE